MEQGQRELSVRDGYALFAATYGAYATPLTALEEPVVRSMVASIPAGRMLDLGCGAGRHAKHLNSRHEVIGIDVSPDMLERARVTVPEAHLIAGSLTAVPLPARSVDACLCALAIGHLPDVEPAIREIARVVRPGGRVVLSELHPAAVAIGGHVIVPVARGGCIRKWAHWHSAYLTAFARYGLKVRECLDVPYTREALDVFEWNDGGATADALIGWPGLLVWDLTVRT